MGCHGSKALDGHVVHASKNTDSFSAIGGEEDNDSLDSRASFDSWPQMLPQRRVSHSSFAVTLCSSAAGGDLEAVRALLARGAQVNEVVGTEGTALHWAARMGRREVVELLLEAGADVSILNEQGYTPYAVAREWSPSRDVVQFLEQHCPRRSHAYYDR